VKWVQHRLLRYERLAGSGRQSIMGWSSTWCMQYSVYAVHGVCCTRCMLFSVYACRSSEGVSTVRSEHDLRRSVPRPATKVLN
jgi:hypothetical protein